jgi:hypothetical protein
VAVEVEVVGNFHLVDPIKELLAMQAQLMAASVKAKAVVTEPVVVEEVAANLAVQEDRLLVATTVHILEKTATVWLQLAQ